MKNSGANTVASEAMDNRNRQGKFNQIEGETSSSFGMSFELEQAKDGLRNAKENGNPEGIAAAEDYLKEIRAKRSAVAFNEIDHKGSKKEGPMTEAFYREQQKDRRRDKSPLVDTVSNLAMEEREKIRQTAEEAAIRQTDEVTKNKSGQNAA